MSRWNHRCCDDCWQAREPDRIPVTVIDDAEHRCCYCGAATRSGIYVRDDPATVACGGKHEEGEE